MGIAVGVPVGYIRSLEPWIRPVLEFLRSLPAPAIVPIAVLLLGATSWTRIAVIAFGSCWAVLLNSIDGARSVDPLLVDTGQVNRLGTAEILRRIVLPAALPQIFAGLRIALGIALIVMVFSEMIASSSGLGYFILTSQRRFLVPETYGGVLLIGLIGWGVQRPVPVRRAAGARWHSANLEVRSVTDELIEVEGIRKAFAVGSGETLAIENVSLSMADGEFVCLVGPSGCGKSTFLRIGRRAAAARAAGTRTVAWTRAGPTCMVFQEYAGASPGRPCDQRPLRLEMASPGGGQRARRHTSAGRAERLRGGLPGSCPAG